MSTSSRPNLILITTDQQRADTIRAGGNPFIRTPHLDYLVKTGIHFRRCYTDSPICISARTTLLTGRHCHHFPEGSGWWGEPTTSAPEQTLPSLLARAGFQTRSIGKLHCEPPRGHYGYEHTVILQDYYRHMRRHPEYGTPMNHGLGQNELDVALSTVHENHSLTTWLVDQAVDFLETRDRGRPFFLHLGFSKPHPPLDPCANYWALYANASVPEPVYGDWSQNPETAPPGFMHTTRRLSGIDGFSREQIIDARRAYYALITQVDYNLGLLLARLRELGLDGETMIVFTSDHGEMLGDHHMGGKTVFLEGAARVPLIVRPVGGESAIRGTTCDQLVCLADIMPTLLEAASVPLDASDKLDGISLMRTYEGTASRDVLHGQCGQFQMVLREGFKYLWCQSDGSELLFDLQSDPGETKNLAADNQAGATLVSLRQALIERMTRTSHQAAVNGTLTPDQPTGSSLTHPTNLWPGLHSRTEEHDILH